jgi:hypothetical protein
MNTRQKRLDVRISTEEALMLEQLAEESGLTVSDIVRVLVRRQHAERFGARAKGGK